VLLGTINGFVDLDLTFGVYDVHTRVAVEHCHDDKVLVTAASIDATVRDARVFVVCC
jgi:hypothetical protein